MIGLQPPIGIDEISLADFPHDGGEEYVSDSELGAGDPVTAIQPALQPIEPATGLLDHRRPSVFGIRPSVRHVVSVPV